MTHQHHPDFSLRADREDPSSWWTLLVGGVLSFGIVISIYWVSAAYYKAEDEVREDVVVRQARVDLESRRLAQKEHLLRAGERTDAEGAKFRTIPVEEAMRAIVAENQAKQKQK